MEYLNTLIDPETWIIVLIIIAFAGIAGTIHFALKLYEAKKWDETQSSMYAKAIIRIADLQADNSKLLVLIEKKSIKLVSQSIHIELLTDELKTAASSTKRKKLRKEIAELKRLNGGYSATIVEMDKENIDLKKQVDFQIGSELKLTEELVRSKEDAVAEITQLRSKNKLLESCLDIKNLDRIQRVMEIVEHRKHQSATKEPKTELARESITDKYYNF